MKKLFIISQFLFMILVLVSYFKCSYCMRGLFMLSVINTAFILKYKQTQKNRDSIKKQTNSKKHFLLISTILLISLFFLSINKDLYLLFLSEFFLIVDIYYTYKAQKAFK